MREIVRTLINEGVETEDILNIVSYIRENYDVNEEDCEGCDANNGEAKPEAKPEPKPMTKGDKLWGRISKAKAKLEKLKNNYAPKKDIINAELSVENAEDAYNRYKGNSLY